MIKVLFENPSFLIALKPQGVSVHDDDGHGEGFLNKLRLERDEESLMLVHRLDRLTSGLMIISRHEEVTKEFNELFRLHKIDKKYLALSSAKPAKKQGTIKGDIEKGRGGAYYLKRSTENPSHTTFITQMMNEKRLFILSPKTGKTHQLRVVMKSLGSPILGDELYGGEKSDRMYLHAYKLNFTYLGEDFEFISYPDEGEEFLSLDFAVNRI